MKYFERESRNDVKPIATLASVQTRRSKFKPIATLASVQQEDPSLNENDNIKPEINKYGNKLKNPDVLNNLNEKLSHLDTDQRNELKD